MERSGLGIICRATSAMPMSLGRASMFLRAGGIPMSPCDKLSSTGAADWLFQLRIPG